jgi:Cu/Ag efflux protein CusF
MNYRRIIPALALLSAVTFFTVPAASLAAVEMAVKGAGERSVAKQITAVITDIDYDSREVTLEGPLGNTITLEAGEEVTRLKEFKKGDFVVATYAASISGDLREPTEAELAEPWVELDAAGVAEAGMNPGVVAGNVIRAVCTVEGMNRASGTVTVLDSRGDFHIIDDVDPARMEGVKLGDTVIITFSQAIALTLEKPAGAE